MADPRGAHAYELANQPVVTMTRKASSTGAIDYTWTVSNRYGAASTDIGKSVGCAESDTARLGQAGDRLVGKLMTVDQLDVGVQISGPMLFSYVANGTAPVLGRGVVCDGAGGVRVAAADSEYTERGVVIYKDATTLTVVVLL